MVKRAYVKPEIVVIREDGSRITLSELTKQMRKQPVESSTSLEYEITGKRKEGETA